MRTMLAIATLILLLLLPAAVAAAGAVDARPLKVTDRTVSLRGAIARGIREHLSLQAAGLSVPIRRRAVTENRAAFDPALEAELGAAGGRELTGSMLYEDEYRESRELGASAGIRKRFRTGLSAGLTLETARRENNSTADALDPQYQDVAVLQLSQPLLRGFGRTVNTAGVRIAEERVRVAGYDYLTQAQAVAAAVERAYYELARAGAVLDYRIESRELARELMMGNRKKLERGVVSITEVEEARTAVAARDEEVIKARQAVEVASNRLKDLIEIRRNHPLYDESLSAGPIPDPERRFPDLGHALGMALASRPEIKALKAKADALDIRLAATKNGRLPRLDLVGTLSANGLSGDDRPVQLFGPPRTSGLSGDYGDALSRMAEGDGYGWSVDLRLTYPLGNRAAEARYDRSRMEKQQLVHRINRIEGAIETEVKNALVATRRSLERVRVAGEFEALARSTLDHEMKRLRRGLSNTFRILRYQTDVVAAGIRKVTAVVDCHLGLADLYQAMGTNLERHGIAIEVMSDED